MDKKLIEDMIELAIEQMKYSYAPYSNFKVGAALLAENGRLYTGCNIENASYTPTNCAERTAFFKAVSEGERKFSAICIVGGMDGIPTEYAATVRCVPAGDAGILQSGYIFNYSCRQQGKNMMYLP